MAILKDYTYRYLKIKYTPNKINNFIYPQQINFVDTKPNVLQIRNYTDGKICIYENNLPISIDTNGNILNNLFIIDSTITRIYTSHKQLDCIFIAGTGNGFIIINSYEGIITSNDLESTKNVTILGG